MSYRLTNQKAMRREFWVSFSELNRKRVVDMGGRKTFVCDTRVTWVDWIDYLQRNGEISEALASRATLK